MANTKISQLPSATFLNSSDVLPTVNLQATKKVTKAVLNGRIFQSTIPLSLTGTQSTVLMASVLIPANSIEENDIINLKLFYSASVFTGSIIPRVYINTASSLTNAILLGSTIQPSSISFGYFERNFMIVQNNQIKGLQASSTNQFTDKAPSNFGLLSGYTLSTFNKAINNFLLVAVELTVSTVQMKIEAISITVN